MTTRRAAGRYTRRAVLALAASAGAALCKTPSRAGAAGRVVPTGARRRAWRGAGQQAPAGTAIAGSLSYVPGSTVKIEQVIGDFDKQLQQPTTNLTATRYGIIGTDLGSSFEHNGSVYFLFGDTLARGAPDPMGFSQSTDPTAPLQIDFLSAGPGTFIPVKAPGIAMGPFEVPVAGLSLGGTMYVAVKTDYSPDNTTDRSVLQTFDETNRTFNVVREVSRMPAGHFLNMTLRYLPEGLAGLPTSDPYVLLFGSGA